MNDWVFRNLGFKGFGYWLAATYWSDFKQRDEGMVFAKINSKDLGRANPGG